MARLTIAGPRTPDNLSDESNTHILPNFSDIVTLRVGPDKSPVIVHTNFLTRASHFFQACLRGNWVEAQTRTITLPDIDPIDCALYLQWAYTSRLPGASASDRGAWHADLPRRQRNKLAANAYDLLSRVALLADRFDDARLKDAVVDAVIDTQDRLALVPSPEVLTVLWEGLPASSKLRALLVDLFATQINVENFTANQPRNPPEFIFEVLIALRKDAVAGAVRDVPDLENRCVYHEHGDGEGECDGGKKKSQR